MPTLRLSSDTHTHAGQQLYEWLAARGRKPNTWPSWETLTPQQQTILAIWAEKLRATVEVP